MDHESHEKERKTQINPPSDTALEPVIAGEEVIQPTSLQAAPEKPRRKPWLWLGLGAGGLLALLLLCAQAFGLTGRLSGTTDNAAAAIPADAQVYLGANLLQLRPEKLDRLVQPYMTQIENPPFGTGNGFLIELEKQYLKPLDIVFSKDVQPWIGQYFGMGISCGDDLKSPIDLEGCDVIFAVEALNAIAADIFIQQWTKSPEGQSDPAGRRQYYQGITIYIVPEKDMAIARSKGLVIFSPRVEAVQAAIDAQAGQSLQDQEAFQQLSRELPGGRFLTFFANQPTQQIMPQISGSGGGLLQTLISTTLPVQAFAAGLSIVEEGLQADAITSYNPQKLTEAQRARLQNAGQAAKIAQVMPADAILLVAGQEIQEAMQIRPESPDAQSNDSMNLLSQFLTEIGFSQEPDILSYLDQEYGLAAVPEADSEVELAGIPIGLLFASHINDSDSLDAAIRKSGQMSPAMEMVATDVDNGHAYQTNRPDGDEQLFISLGEEYMAAGSSRWRVAEILNPGTTLSENPEYKEIWAHFETGITPILYLDVASLLDSLEKGQGEYDELPQEIRFLKPIHHLAIGAMPFKDNLGHTTAIIFVN